MSTLSDMMVRLVPIIYSGSPAIGISIPFTHTTTIEQQANHLALELSGMGCELLKVNDSHSNAIIRAQTKTHQLTHIIYNKQYDEDEMAEILVASGEDFSQFHSGHDLNSFMALGEPVWKYFDHSISLSLDAHPNLFFFVEIDQLKPVTLEMYQQFVAKSQTQSSTATSLKSTAASTSSSMKHPPPPPSSPPAIPAPPLHFSNSPSVAPSTSSHPPPIPASPSSGFSVSSWNILSSDYAHPETFYYTKPEHLKFSYRQTKILHELEKVNTDIELMQEVDYDAIEEGVFDSPVYGSIFLRRPNQKRDGLLIRFKEDLFELLEIPQLITLDGRFAKHATERKKDTMGYRIQTKSVNLSALVPKVKKSKPVPILKNTDPAEVAQRQAERNLMKRQSHILDRLALLEDQLDAIQARILQPPTVALQRSISQERATKRRVSDESDSADDVLPTANPIPAAHIHPPPEPSVAHVAHGVPPLFHAIHFNDLSLLTRSKKNCTTSLFARYKRENIGLCVLLRHRPTGQLVLVATCHLFWNPSFDDVKVAQAQFMLQHIQELLKQIGQIHPSSTVALVLGGDLNSTPDSPVYQLLTQGQTPILKQVLPLPIDPSTSTTPVPIVSSHFHDVVIDADSAPPANGLIRLLLDSTLLKITKWLRAIGVDTICQTSSNLNSESGSETAIVEAFFQTARSEGRIIVSQNKSLLKRRNLPAHYHLPSGLKEPLDIFLDIVKHFNFTWSEPLFYHRCTTCNAIVNQVEKEEYENFDFLPDVYKGGLNDDGDPLFITRCSGFTCGRVRWWSSESQRSTRMKLFQVRLDMDVEIEDIVDSNSGQENGLIEEEADDEYGQATNPEPVSVKSPKKKSPSPKNEVSPSTTTSSDVPTSKPSPSSQTPLTDAELAAARAARKSEKQAQKAARAKQSAERKVLNASRNNFTLSVESAALRGDDGDYLFDMKPSAPSVKNSSISPIPATTEPSSTDPSTSPEPMIGPVPYTLAYQKQKLLDAATTNTSSKDCTNCGRPHPISDDPGASGELWWTAAKKLKMIEVEKRIMWETRKLIRERKERQKFALQSQADVDQQVVSEKKVRPIKLKDVTQPVPAATSMDSTTTTTTEFLFAHELHTYWQHTIDLGETPQGHSYHSHSLPLVSAYSSPSHSHGRPDRCLMTERTEPELTNITPKFMEVIDYLLFSSNNLQRVHVRQLPTKKELEASGVVGCPTTDWPSDHELLTASFALLSSSSKS